MLSWEGPLCHKHTNKEIRCFANFFSEETAHLFFNGHFCFLATRKYCINLYLLLTGTDNSGAICGSWAVEEKEKGNLKEIYHFFLFILLIQIIWSLLNFLGFANYQAETRPCRYSIVIK